jgi:hypothetical protein
MNKQINREASSVLYERVPFNVDISEYHIHICNMEYTLGGIFGEGPKWSSLSRSWWSSDAHESAGFPKFILRIRNFRFNLNFNSPTGSFLPDTSDGITREDIHVLNLRNSVRELSNACISGDNTVRRPKDAIIQLEIHPTDNCDNHWAGDETLAALALVTEPLRLMGPVCRAIMNGFTTEKFWLPVPHPGRGIDTDWFKTEYRKFQSEWSGMMKTQTNTQSTLNRCTAEWTKKEIIAKAQLNVIKEILKVFLGKGLVTRHSSCSGAFDPIKGINLVVYVSQLACEQYDLKALEMIQHILKDLWVKFCRGAQESLRHVTDSLLQVVEDPTGRLGMIKDHLEALALRADKPTYQTLRSLWLELVKRENEWTPGPGSRLVSEDRLRRYYILDPGVRGNSEPLPYCVLKTPRVVSLLLLCRFGDIGLTRPGASDVWNLDSLRPDASLRSPNVIVRRHTMSFLHRTGYMSDTLTEICLLD